MRHHKLFHIKTVTSFFVLSLFLSCGSSEKNEKVKINDTSDIALQPADTVKEFAEIPFRTQHFSFAKNQGIRIKGIGGTMIKIQNSILEFEDGSLPDDSIIIELKECYTIKDIISNKLTTESKYGILETGGMVNISAKSNGKRLRVKNGKSFEIRFHIKGKRKDGMRLFTGLPNKDGFTTWDSLINQKQVKNLKDTVFSEYGNNKMSKDDLTHYVFNSFNLGWLNCDRIIGNGDVQVIASVQHEDNPTLLMVFKNMSIVKLPTKQEKQFIFWGLPKDSPVSLIGYYKKGGINYFFHKDIILDSNSEIKVDFEKITPIQMEKKIDEIMHENKSFPLF